jgi:hypothetical protein
MRVRYTVEAMARTDVQLMLDVKAVDTASFDLLQKYRTPLVNFLYRMVRDTATAEDLAQEVFLRIYRARKDYFAGAKFTTWLFRICHEPGAEFASRQSIPANGSLARGPGPRRRGADSGTYARHANFRRGGSSRSARTCKNGTI